MKLDSNADYVYIYRSSDVNPDMTITRSEAQILSDALVALLALPVTPA